MNKQLQVSWKSRGWIIVLSFILSLLLLETSLRVYDLSRGLGFFSSHRNPFSNHHTRIIPFRTFGFNLYQNVNGVKHISSRHGEFYPVQKLPGTYRIVVFGGSTTENEHSFIETKTHYPLVLQSRLRTALETEKIEVINVGMAGYATPHSLILLELDVLSWDPDMVIVSHNINDLLAAYWPDFAFDYSNKYGNEYYLPNHASGFSASDKIFQHFQLYWSIDYRINKIRRNKISDLTRTSYGNELSPVVMEVFKRNIRSFVALAKQNGIIVLLGNQPLQPSKEFFDIHMRRKTYNDIVTYPLHSEFISHHQAFNAIIQQVAEENNVFFVNNALKFDGDQALFIDFVHYTPMGVEVLAENYTGFILRENIIGMP
jgi:hypothetical protein